MASLNIYQIKFGITDHDEILTDRDRLRSYPVRAGRSLLGILYLQRTRLRLPRWLPFFQDLVDFEGVELRTAAVAAVLVVQRGDRLFALTFGHGRWLIKDGVVEPRFGLRVTLNAIDPASIRSIDHKRLEAVSRHTREQLSRASGLQYFGLDVERDLLRAVTGAPLDQTLGRRFSGADQLAVVGDISIRQLPEQLDRYAALATDTTYRATFSWVDNIAEVTDAELKAHLDEVLVRRLRRGALDNVLLAPPDVLDWDDVAGFRYRSAAAAPVHEELTLDDYFADRGPRANLTLEQLENDRVRCVSAIDGADRQQWSVLRCLVAELNVRHRTYILNESKWYQVDAAFLASIEETIRALPRTTAPLPPFRQRSEGAYNQRVAERDAGRFALMDRRLIRSLGRGRIEACDLYSRDRQFVHIKRYGGSSVLSHLFSQGVVSAELFLSDRHFRQEFNDLLPAPYRAANPAAAIAPADYEVAYGVITSRGRELQLPFFSKVNLRNATRLLRQFGYAVTLTPIPTA